MENTLITPLWHIPHLWGPGVVGQSWAASPKSACPHLRFRQPRPWTHLYVHQLVGRDG